MFPPSELKHS